MSSELVEVIELSIPLNGFLRAGKTGLGYVLLTFNSIEWIPFLVESEEECKSESAFNSIEWIQGSYRGHHYP